MRKAWKMNDAIKVLGLAVAAFALLVFLCPNTADAAITFKKQAGDKEVKVNMYGFSQLLAGGGKGLATRADKSDDGLRFWADRIRMGWDLFCGKVVGKLFLDFNKSHTNAGAGLPEMIKDAFVGYRFNKALMPRLGMIKAPHGMNFTIPGWNLDIFHRSSLDKGLVLERDMGLIVSGRDIGYGDFAKVTGKEMGHERPWQGFGYDVMVANSAGRSKAVKRQDQMAEETTGDALTYVGRIMFDWTEKLHLEASYAENEEAGGRYTEDYESYDIGLDSHIGPWNFKYEYINGENIQGSNNWEQDCHVILAAYAFHPQVEAVVKHYAASVDKGGSSYDLGNTYLGLNFYLEPYTTKMTRGAKRQRQSHKVVVNYVFTTGDDGESEWESVSPIGGYTDSVLAVQYQYKF